ncbi:SusC/RagA family TonB-linked outer membrane protein [Saccharicrinis sp. GN24d3]|uniref:SusC/RagA family TonB-linked outer membrane protein n=1 Tax=Saccharicrinis sp. GN24d3 TaxID=3458416 RepID=UPI004035BEC1
MNKEIEENETNKNKSMKSIFYILISTLLLLSSNLFAQGRVVTGKVTDASDGSPLPGVNIILLPSQKGTITDFDGNFKLMIREQDEDSEEILVSFIGMKTIKVPFTKQSSFHFKMEEEVNELEQVVVTSSYGTKKLKEDVVGSITTIQAKDIQVDQAFESVDKMLEGQIAGVIMEAGSSPLDPVSIDIRGQGTLTNNTTLGTSSQPLIIIDGVIMTEETGMDSQYFDGGGVFSEDFLNPLAQIAPEDIESINVLKDAAAVGIYGADGANGVILITTKGGRKGKLRFNASTQQGYQEAVNRIKYLSGEQYTDLRNEYLRNTGQDEIAYNGVNTDWFDLLNRNGSYQKYAMSVSGGSELFTFRAGVNYLKINEPQNGNNSNQYKLSSKLNYRDDKLQLTLSLNPSIIQKENPNIYYSYAFAPNIAPYNEDGTFGEIGVQGMANPLAALEQNINESDTYGIMSSFDAIYNITEDWNLFTSFGIDYKDKEQDRYFSGANESGRYSGTFEVDGIEYPRWGRRVINQRQSTSWSWKGNTSFKKQITESHYFDIMAGAELYESKADLQYHSGAGFVNPDIINPVSAAVQDDDPETEKDETNSNQNDGSDINNNSRVSLYSQINYNFKKKYYLLVNLRRDQSSVFGDNTDVAFNGGAGVSWAISKESFLNDVKWIDFLKIRASFGSTGNSRIGSYSSKGLYYLSTSFGYNRLHYARPDDAPNDELGWEKNFKYDLGIDFNFLKRFTFTAEYFYDDIQNMISSRDVPSETGYNSTQINGTNMANQGLEFALSSKIINAPGFKWDMRVNLSTLKNEITSLKNFGDDYSLSSTATSIRQGYSTSTIWGIKWVGIDPATGRDLLEKDGEIYDAATYNNIFSAVDWVPIGNRQPDFYGGFSTSFSYRNNLKLSVRGSYKYGVDKMVDDELIAKYNITVNRNLSVNAYDYWKQPGDIATQPAVTSDNPPISNYNKYVYDASHFKINNISLSYILPVAKMNIFLDNLVVNFDVSNVATFYKDKSPYGKNGIKEFYYLYPQARTWSLGIKASF